MISNDPYHDAWLDEGMASFGTNVFYSRLEDTDLELSNRFNVLTPLPSNLPLDHYPLDNQNSYIFGQSTYHLWNIFKQHGGIDRAEQFLQEYYSHYKFKEVDTQEFVRFMKDYLTLDNDSLFEDWLLLK